MYSNKYQAKHQKVFPSICQTCLPHQMLFLCAFPLENSAKFVHNDAFFFALVSSLFGFGCLFFILFQLCKFCTFGCFLCVSYYFVSYKWNVQFFFVFTQTQTSHKTTPNEKRRSE